jgi:hypothetical protein
MARPAPTWPQDPGVSPCAVSAGPSRRLELPDGRIVSVDVKSVAASGGSVIAVGQYAYVFPRGSTPTTSPVQRDSIIGVLIDSRGAVTLVPSPFGHRPIRYSRVAPGRDGSFHAVFVPGSESDSLPQPDTATIWYAQFAGGAWRVPVPVATTSDAALEEELTSNLLVWNGSLSLAFSFLDRSNAESGGGLVLLRRRDGRWTSDTLRTYREPSMVRTARAPDGSSVSVLFAQSVANARAEDVWLTRLDSAWSVPRRLGGRAGHPVSDLALASVAGGLVPSWSTWQWLDDATNRLEWTRIGLDGTPARAAVVDSGKTTYPFEMIALDNRPLWLFRGEPYGTTASYAMAIGGEALHRGTVTIPLHNPLPKAIALSPARVLVFTMKRGQAGDEPMIASYATVLEFRCSRSARR